MYILIVYLITLCVVDCNLYTPLLSSNTLYTFSILYIHLPTFQPPVDGARSLASSPVKGFYRKIKSLVWYLLGSFDRSAVSLRNLKIILNYSLYFNIFVKLHR